MRTIAVVALTLMLSPKAVAAQGDALTEQQAFTLCTAANALIATKVDGIFGEILMGEARRLAANVEDPAQIEGAMRSIQQTYNSGKYTWEQLVTFAEECSAVL